MGDGHIPDHEPGPWRLETYDDGSTVDLDGYTGGGHPAGHWGELTLRFIAADGTVTVRDYKAGPHRPPAVT